MDAVAVEQQMMSVGSMVVSRFEDAGMPLRVLTVVDYIDADGQRGLCWHASDETRTWDVLGMIRAVELGIVSDYAGGDG